MNRRLFIIGDFSPERETHVLTNEAITHSLDELGAKLDVSWVPTPDVSDEVLANADGIWIGTGSPYRALKGALAAIKFAREKRVTCLGTCSGFQHIIVEYATHVLALKSVGHGEYDTDKDHLVISELACSLTGHEMYVTLTEGSRVHRLYGKPNIKERYYCSYGINPEYEERLLTGPIQATGRDANGEIRVIEFSNHPFMLATLFVPQALSTKEVPNPLVTGFINTILNS